MSDVAGVEPCVIFDYDLTLVDLRLDRGIMRNSILRALERLGLEELFDHEKTTFVNYREIVDVKLAGSVDKARIKRFLDWNMASGELRTVDLARPIPGCREVLSALRQDNYRIGIVSSNSRRVIERTGRRLRLLRLVDSVWGREDEGRSKPSPDKLIACSRSLGCSSGVYVGDDPSDMEAARAAGLVGIAALRRTDRLPTPSPSLLTRLGARFVVESLDEVLSVLRTLGWSFQEDRGRRAQRAG